MDVFIVCVDQARGSIKTLSPVRDDNRVIMDAENSHIDALGASGPWPAPEGARPGAAIKSFIAANTIADIGPLGDKYVSILLTARPIHWTIKKSIIAHFYAARGQ